MRRWLAVALVLPLAGCGEPSGADAPMGIGCATTDASALWREPGLHAALPDAARRAGVPVVSMEPDVPPLPLRHPDLDARGTPYALMHVQWVSPEQVGVWMVSARPGEHEVAVHAGFDDPRLLPLFRAFAEQVGLADAPDLPAWERALAHAPRDQWPPHVLLVGEPRLEPLYDRLREGLVAEEPALGSLRVSDGAWTFLLQIPMAAVHLGELRLHVDATDRVSAFTPLPPGEEPWPLLEARVREAFAAMGLPPPTFEGVDPPRGRC